MPGAGTLARARLPAAMLLLPDLDARLERLVQIEHAAALEVLEQAGDRLVRLAARRGERFEDAAVVVPELVAQLDVPHPRPRAWGWWTLALRKASWRLGW